MIDIVVKKNTKSGREYAQESGFDDRARRVVRVVPKNETIRKYLKHQPSGKGFLAEGSIEWPNDRFTQNRLSDGDIRIITAEEQRDRDKQKKEHDASHPKPAQA